ncbi:MAG: hypothetical protein GKR87_00725 [Kiritimatiellae bacterium]|nr:hypothetical protein [Kiritimatiellia bacterium]
MNRSSQVHFLRHLILQSTRQLNAVFCMNHLGQKELQKNLDAPSGCACVFLQPFASKAFAQKSHV